MSELYTILCTHGWAWTLVVAAFGAGFAWRGRLECRDRGDIGSPNAGRGFPVVPSPAEPVNDWQDPSLAVNERHDQQS